jgi:hypothetical protein
MSFKSKVAAAAATPDSLAANPVKPRNELRYMPIKRQAEQVIRLVKKV